jgi:hypothetical protein
MGSPSYMRSVVDRKVANAAHDCNILITYLLTLPIKRGFQIQQYIGLSVRAVASIMRGLIG